MLFLRVGVDRGCGGCLAPQFEDGSFEYVPIPESKAVSLNRGVSYSEIPARSGGTLLRWVRQDGLAHYDPEFESFTYGEPNNPKRLQLLRLQPGDYLVFYAGFHGATISAGTCFVIGYFCVKMVHEVRHEDTWPPAHLVHLHRNAHFRRSSPESSLVVVEGDQSRSRLLGKLKPLSDPNQMVLPDVEDKIGFGGSVKRAIGRWVPRTHYGSAEAWLLMNEPVGGSLQVPHIGLFR
ncbi:Nmad3 family putative nucleotide modification protein [Cupriavidus alkaliphilus]|uniref:Nmad3 family putative nucleotide modification protein n=1 Tax=Cupriavidus alkaliphilus TaxID=942866 RepID=UPI001428958F